MAVDPPNIIGRGDRQEYQCARRARLEKTREAARKRRAADPEGYREYGRKWRAANPQKVREYQRRWGAANKNKRATREERLTKRAAARLRKDKAVSTQLRSWGRRPVVNVTWRRERNEELLT